MILPDVNVVVYAHREDAVDHVVTGKGWKTSREHGKWRM